MFGLVIFCVAAVSAAPYYGSGYNPMPFHPEHHYGRLSRPDFGEHVFDTRRFWSELANELRDLDTMLADFYRRFPTPASSSQGIVGKEFKVTIPLGGFEEKDIIVKARTGLLMVQAIHKYEGEVQKNYLDVRTLPDCVKMNGSWTYSEGVLKIVFPLKTESTTDVVPVVNGDTTTETTASPVTEGIKESREEIDNQVEIDDRDADVGLERGDVEKERQLSKNEDWRNSVEATTYAVDLSNDVEFVPVRY